MSSPTSLTRVQGGQSDTIHLDITNGPLLSELNVSTPVDNMLQQNTKAGILYSIGAAAQSGVDTLNDESAQYAQGISSLGNIKADKASPTFTGVVIKEDTHNKDGAFKLRKDNDNGDEVVFHYEGPNSSNLVISQYAGTNKKGEIKFLGNTPSGSNTVRIHGKNVDIGFDNKENDGNATTLTKIHSNTNIVSNKHIKFTDTRTKDHGLQFKHTGTNTTIQAGMYGSYGQSDLGQFKVTHTNNTGTTDVLVVDRDNAYTKLESDRTDIKNAKIAGYAQVGDLPSGVTAAAGMIIFDGTNFKGYNGSAWVTLG